MDSIWRHLNELQLEDPNVQPDWVPASAQCPNIIVENVPRPRIDRRYSALRCATGSIGWSTIASSQGFRRGAHYTELEMQTSCCNFMMGVLYPPKDEMLNASSLSSHLGSSQTELMIYSTGFTFSGFTKTSSSRHSCEYFANGSCKFANSCKNLHNSPPSCVHRLTSGGIKGESIDLDTNVTKGCRFGLFMDLVKSELMLFFFGASNRSDTPNKEIRLCTLASNRKYYFAFSLDESTKVIVAANPPAPDSIHGYKETIGHLITHLEMLQRKMQLMAKNASANEEMLENLTNDYERLLRYLDPSAYSSSDEHDR